jgi:hypothetical protein
VEGDRGVWRFDPEEVERVASDIQSGRVRIWAALHSETPSLTQDGDSCAECERLRSRLQQLEAELQRRVARHRLYVEEAEGVRMAEKKEQAEMARQLDEGVAALLLAVAEIESTDCDY